MRLSKDQLIDKVARGLIKAGWTIKSRNRHVRLENPDTRQCITVPGSPSDRRVAQNWIHQLKRLGVPVCC